MNRPFTTLFLLLSVDGKISTGSTDGMDIDVDFPNIPGLKEGLHQYYEIEKTTDLYSLNTGRVFEKIGVNEGRVFQDDVPAYFVVVDNKPHLTSQGVTHLAEHTKGVFIATTNPQHPAIELSKDDSRIVPFLYKDEIDFTDLFSRLSKDYKVDRMTIQSGGILNTELVRQGLIDRILVVVAPALIGGKDTSTLMDGASLRTKEELHHIKPLTLVRAEPLEDSYLLLEYQVSK